MSSFNVIKTFIQVVFMSRWEIFLIIIGVIFVLHAVVALYYG